MLDTTAETAPDRRPAIVICAWDADERAWDPVEDLSGEPWSPGGARTIAIPPAAPADLASALVEQLQDDQTRALLLIGRSSLPKGFQVQMRADSHALGGEARIDAISPSVARATAHVAEIVRALEDAGLSASSTSEAEDDAGSYLLYRVLTSLREGVDTPAIGLLRASANEPDAAVQRAVKAAAEAMARHLSPLPRRRVG